MPPPLALVINPHAADFKLYDEWMHPLGLYFLIDLLCRNRFDVRFFNCLERRPDDRSKRYNTGDFPCAEIEKPPLYRSIPRNYKRYGRPAPELQAFLASSPRPDLICIGSMMTYWAPGVRFSVETVAEAYPGVPTVIGGIAARLMPSALTAMMPKPVLINPSVIDNDTVVLHPALPPLTIKTPLSLRPGFEMLSQPLHGPVLASLGCPMNCSYCASGVLQGPFRRRGLEMIIEETAFLAGDRGISDFAFYDDALLYGPDDWLFSLLDVFTRLPHPVRLHAPNGLHLHCINDRLACAMKAAGFGMLRFGYESSATVHAGDTSAKISRKEADARITSLLNAGFDGNRIGVYVMAGLPGQTPNQVLEEIDFLLDCGVKPKPVWLSPVPGTRLFDHYAREFPSIKTDPLWHNDMFFVTQLPGWSWEAMEKIRARAARRPLDDDFSSS
jgi:hypothetical protein